MDDSSYRDGESASCVLSEEETFRRIGTAVRVESVSAVVRRGAAPCLGTA